MPDGIVESQQTSESTGQQPQQGITRSRLVQRLLEASSSLPQFIHDLLTTQAVVVAGTEAAAFLIEQQTEGPLPFSLRPIAHIRPDSSSAEQRQAAINAFQEIIKPCVQQSKDGAVEIGTPDDAGEAQFCLITLLRSEAQIVAVSAVITRCRNLERARQRLISMQLVAGYFELFSLRRGADNARLIAQSHQHVLQLTSAVATAEGFESAAMNLCNELATRTGAVRVAIGWLKGRNIRVKALSHTEKFDKKQELIVELEKVMDECHDQEEIVQYDPAGACSPNVTRAAAAYSKYQGGNILLSLPLRRQNEIIGVVTLEFASKQTLGEQAAQGLAVAVDLLAPQLYDRYQNDRYLITKVGLSVQHSAKQVAGPKHMLAKTIVLLSLGTIAFLTFYKPMFRVTAPFQFVPQEKRSVCVPYDGRIEELAKVEQTTSDGKTELVWLTPGMPVKKGQFLARLDTYELLSKKDKAQAEASAALQKAQNAAADNPPRIAEAGIAEQEYKQAMAQVRLFEQQIAQAEIVAPVDGAILQGDLRDKVGATVKQGDALFEVGDPASLRVELAVSERDVQWLNIGQTGYLATRGLPTAKKQFRVERIVQLGVPKEGKNVFMIYGKMLETPENSLAGMEGQARVDIRNERLIWIWTHKVVEWVRLYLWI